MTWEHWTGPGRAPTRRETWLMVENARLRAALARVGVNIEEALAEAGEETPCVGNGPASTASEMLWRRQVEELRQAVRARDDFIAIAAHELRNPMTPIIGLAEAALIAAQDAGSAISPRVPTMLGLLHRAAQDFIRRATRLLDVGRIASGNLELDLSEIDLSELVRSVAQRYAVVADHGGSALELEVEDAICGIWDRLAAEEIVENLLSNALKFGIGKPVALRLRLEACSAWLEVQDRGVGMTPEQQTRIFGRFEQVMRQHRGSGFGVGLWVASRLVAAMAGRITVSSQPGQGSTFRVMLPPHTPGTRSDDACRRMSLRPARRASNGFRAWCRASTRCCAAASCGAAST